MKPEEIQQLHLSLLLILDAAADVGLQEASMLPRLRLEFATLTAPELAVQLRALADKKWVISHQPSLGGLRWKILSLGTAALQEAGLA